MVYAFIFSSLFPSWIHNLLPICEGVFNMGVITKTQYKERGKAKNHCSKCCNKVILRPKYPYNAIGYNRYARCTCC